MIIASFIASMLIAWCLTAAIAFCLILVARRSTNGKWAGRQVMLLSVGCLVMGPLAVVIGIFDFFEACIDRLL